MKSFQIKEREEEEGREGGKEGRRGEGQTILFPERHILKLAMCLQCQFFRKIKVIHRNCV